MAYTETNTLSRKVKQGSTHLFCQSVIHSFRTIDWEGELIGLIYGIQIQNIYTIQSVMYRLQNYKIITQYSACISMYTSRYALCHLLLNKINLFNSTGVTESISQSNGDPGAGRPAPPPPFWRTSKLQKEGGKLIVCARMWHGPPLPPHPPFLLYPP